MVGSNDEPKLLLPALKPFYDFVIPLSWFVVRAAAGWNLLVHSWGKITVGPAPGFLKAFVDIGFTPPAPWFWTALFTETLAGIALILGLFTRFFAAAAAMTKGQLAMAVAMIYPEPEKSAARNSLLAIASAATCRTSSSEKRPRGFSIAPTRSRKTERRSTGTAFAAVMMISSWLSDRETMCRMIIQKRPFAGNTGRGNSKARWPRLKLLLTFA